MRAELRPTMNGDKEHRDDTPATEAGAARPVSDEGHSAATRAERLPRVRSGPRAPDNVFFRLLVPAGVLFCAAILMSVMASLGHPESAVNIAIARYSPVVIAILAGLILSVGITAMAIDRRRTLKLRESMAAKNEGAAEASPRDS
jgi:ABC-type transport system involved in cytochrome bd biosynthesis fused ATPase/permease subunit